MLASCGKRGDPLPPLRPVPAAAEAVRLRQVGDRLMLEWQAPQRNEDGTTENVSLQKARILRRVVDLQALVEAQTRPAEEKPSGAEGPPAGEEDLSEPSAPEPAASVPAQEASSDEPAPAEGAREAAAETPRTPIAPSAEAVTGEPPPTETPKRPPLVIPPFPTEAVELTSIPSVTLGDTLSYEEPVEPAWIGKRVEYAVVYENRKKRASRLSAVVQIDPVATLAPPGGLSADVGDGFVAVRWTPHRLPEAPEEPGQIVFAVYRRLEGSPEYPEAPLADALAEPRFEDRDIVFGSTFCYVATSRVAPPRKEEETAEGEAKEEPEATSAAAETPSTETPALEEEAKGPIVPIVPPVKNPPRIESVPSEELCLTPDDRFAPPAPTAVAVVPVADGLLLTWRGVEAPDLKGYRVYRGAREGGPFQLLAEVPRASYTDTDVRSGQTYFYMVTAIDDAAGTNESSWSEVVSGRLP